MTLRIDVNIIAGFFAGAHGAYVNLPTSSFSVRSDKCIFYDDQCNPVLEHNFRQDCDRMPISQEGLQVTFVKEIEIKYGGARYLARPRYRFRDGDLETYKIFHSKLSGCSFRGDVKTSAVTGSRGVKTGSEFVKMWVLENKKQSFITVPLQIGTGQMQLFTIWMRWTKPPERHGSTSLLLRLHQEHHAERRFGLIRIGRPRPTPTPHEDQHDEGLAELRRHFDHLQFKFDSSSDRERLEDFLRESADRLARTPHPALPNEPDIRQPRKELLKNSRFYHQQLHGDQIRLMRIDRGKGQELIRIELETFSLRDPLNFEALSYCWTDGSKEREVTVNGEPGFIMSGHLWNALRRLRSRNTLRYLWIDAFCINQSDDEERTHQITLMAQIYRKARRTIIWISEFDDTSGEDTCKRIGAASGDREVEEPTLCAPDSAAAVTHFNDFHLLRHDMVPLLAREELEDTGRVWWKRLWCVQEFFFSRNQQSVYIAQHALTWDQFLDLMDAVRKDLSQGPIRKNDDPLILFRQLRDEGQAQAHEGFNLRKLLQLTGKFHCGLPCDRVYALLGMTTLAREIITPDVNDKDWQVFEKATMFLIEEAGTLTALMDERINRHENAAYVSDSGPSIGTWVPDFTQLAAIEKQTEYKAGRGRPDAQRIQRDDAQAPSELKILAVPFDRIWARTTVDQLPNPEKSPSGSLIYPSLAQPGRLVKKLLHLLEDTENKDFERSADFEQLRRTPHFGLLILDYLFDDRRSISEEMKRRRREADTNMTDFYQEEKEEDLRYLERVGAKAADHAYVEAYWARKLSYLNNNNVDISRAIDLHAWPWKELIASTEGNRSFQELTFDFENLFLYARKSGQYYFFGDKFEIPMRKTLLECTHEAEMLQKLPMDYRHRNEPIEIHAYSKKARERDFFRTEHGFFGLGPASLEVGDQVIVPFGCSHPIIIREKVGGKVAGHAVWELVGEATIQCIMDGNWTSRPTARPERYYHLV